MSDFVSVMDLLDESNYAQQKAIADEVAGITFSVRRKMDQGLTPDEMETAKAVKAAAEAAEEILSKIMK